MKVLLGSFVADARGKIGGHQMSTGASGNYLGNISRPTNRKTVKQLANRGIFAQLARKWSELSESHRAQWNTAAPLWASTNVFGSVVKISGKHLFCKLNQVRLRNSLSFLMQPPQRTSFPTMQFGSVTFHVFDGPGEYDLQDIYLGAPIQVSASPPKRPGVSVAPREMKFLAMLDPFEVANYDPAEQYAKVYPMPRVGQKIFYRFQSVNIDTGDISIGVTGSTITIT